MRNKKTLWVIGIVLFVLIIDQALKIYIKTTMSLGEEIYLFGDWGRLHFTENEGMAFGLELWGEHGKLILSLFRIMAVMFMSYYLHTLIKQKASMGLIVSIALILAGALGNIIDSAVYGILFTESSPYAVAEYVGFAGEGYAQALHGKVVDMWYFPIWTGQFPDNFPIWANEYFVFFRPVFNIADVSISVGVLLIILFQRSFFKQLEEDEKTPNSTAKAVNVAVNAETGELPADLKV